MEDNTNVAGESTQAADPYHPSPDSPSSTTSSSTRLTKRQLINLRVPKCLEWIAGNWSWSKVKPVIRCAVVGWISAVLFIIPKVEAFMGQASFLILIAAFLSPPSDPFMAVIEREFLLLLFVVVAWAWASLGIFLANLARTTSDPTVTLGQAISGDYIEAAPTVVIGVFVFLGSAFFLYIKTRQGPGPYLFPTVLACLCIDISLTTAVLFPYPFYLVGRSVVIPLGFHSVLAVLGSLLIFPSTISAQFTARLQLVLAPLIAALNLHREILDTSIDSDDFHSLASTISTSISQSEANFVLLAASARLLSSDFVYSRFAPDDFRVFQTLGRKLAGRAHGMSLYLKLIDSSSDRFPITPAPSLPSSPGPSSPISPLGRSPELVKLPINVGKSEGSDHEDDGAMAPVSPKDRPPSKSSPGVGPQHHHHHHHHHHLLHTSLLHSSLKRKREEHAVGVFESQRYLNLEATRLNDPYEETYSQRMMGLLQECCTDLLMVTREGFIGISDWLGGVHDSRFSFWVSTKEKVGLKQTKLDAVQKLRNDVSTILEGFRNDKRLKVLDPYRPAFEKTGETHEFVMPPHRYLFNCYVYQFHLIQLSGVVISILDEIIRLETERSRCRFWTPVKRLLTWDRYDISEHVENDDDDDPDIIQGVQPQVQEDLGMPRRRDPDALPPRNVFEWLMSMLYYATAALAHGNALFAIKAGLLTAILCLPTFLQSSALFAYNNRFVWAIFMGQLTLARFRGDTAFAFITRILSTFGGGVVGMVMWYVSCGNGRGNPYGLAVVCGVCFPFFFFARLYRPGPPITTILFFVTAILVIGYSYQDIHIEVPGSPGYGFTVAWRRFVLVAVGVTAAFIFSLLPPSTTIRQYQRRLLSTTCTELGSIYCSIISFANTRVESEAHEIITCLLAIRSKLKRSVVLRTNVIYEFSLRGRWPAKRYHNIMELQLQIAYSLSHLMSVMEQLEPTWTRAFLNRTRFVDPDFQGDVLAVIAMIASSLRTGDPLPQITPTPLLDRFMEKYHGLDIIHKESEEDYGLPRALTVEMLQHEQYLIFCVGIATAFNIINRLDRLMIAAKEIVGEQYHIHGIGMVANTRSNTFEAGPRMDPVQLRPPKDA